MIVSVGGFKTSRDFRHLSTRSRHREVSMAASSSLCELFDCRPHQVTESQSPVRLSMDRRGTYSQSIRWIPPSDTSFVDSKVRGASGERVKGIVALMYHEHQ